MNSDTGLAPNLRRNGDLFVQFKVRMKKSGPATGGTASMRSGNAESRAVHATRVPKGSPKPSILVRSTFKITGKVQGVYFRKFTQQRAVELGIYGTVKNEEDGSVSGVIEGRIEKINELKYWLQFTGSPKSKIETADFQDEQPCDSRIYERFDILK